MSLSLAKSPSTDPPEFITALKAGDGAAFEQLVRDNEPRLLGIARRILRSDADARDALQDAWVSAFRALPRFDGRCCVSSWLYRITMNSALSLLRARRRRSEESVDDREWSNLLEPIQYPAPDIEREEIRALLESALDRLPERYRSVLLLRDIGELDTTEASHALGISKSAVKVRLHRARRALRASLPWYLDSPTRLRVVG